MPFPTKHSQTNYNNNKPTTNSATKVDVGKQRTSCNGMDNGTEIISNKPIQKNNIESHTLGDITIIDYNNNKYIALYIENVHGEDKFCYLYLNSGDGLKKFEYVEPLIQKYKCVYYREEDNIKGFLSCIY
jgi:hypothetical protein